MNHNIVVVGSWDARVRTCEVRSTIRAEQAANQFELRTLVGSEKAAFSAQIEALRQSGSSEVRSKR